MTISGERKYEHTETEQEADKDTDKNKNDDELQFYRKERYHGKFVRNIVLPENIEQDPTKIKAAYNDGVLNISVPKKEIYESDHEPHKIVIS